jgi:hypothetical protein
MFLLLPVKVKSVLQLITDALALRGVTVASVLLLVDVSSTTTLKPCQSDVIPDARRAKRTPV